MRIIDAQHHEPSVWLEWDALDEATRDKLLVELELATMNAVGVAGAVLHPSRREWAEAAALRMPGRFAVVVNYPRPTLRSEPDVHAAVAAERENPAVVGLRIVLNARSPRWLVPGRPGPAEATAVAHDLADGVAFFEAGGYDALLTACEREEMPLFVFSPTRLDVVERIAQRHPGLSLVVDHLGLSQPPVADSDDPPFRYIPDLLRLARYPLVTVKLCGVPALSGEPYPYGDVWKPVLQVVDAFGAERIMWASDISRITGRAGFAMRNPLGESAYRGKHNYAESLHYILDSSELDAQQKEWILGGTARRVLKWSGCAGGDH